MLDLFNRWFTSAAGVWHTFILVIAVVVWERIDPGADAHGFWLLYWLTVYSAVTQPALAYVARRSGEQQEEILRRLERILLHVEEMRGAK